MNLCFADTRTQQTFLLNVKPNAVCLTLEQSTVYTFDRAGRLVTAVIQDRTYRRGLDNRVLCKWREPGARRRWLSEPEIRTFISQIGSDTGNAAAALDQCLRSGTGTKAHERDICESISWLKRIIAFDYPALCLDADRASQIYRPIGILPPDQYLAMVLQATEGCHYNRCSFCSFYHDRPFHIKSAGEFENHVAAVLGFLGEGVTLRKSVFLADANALCIPRDDLLPMLDLVNTMIPARVGLQGGGLHICSFMDLFSERYKTSGDYAELRAKNLKRVYLGVETGCKDLLRFLRKPQTPGDIRETVSAIKAGGLNIGVILMLGIGGDKFAQAHVRESAALLNSLPWSDGDLVFLSEFVEFPNLEYTSLARDAGIHPLTPVEAAQQYSALRNAIRRVQSVPRVSPYNTEAFIY
jgi:radical SAM family protein